MADRFLFHTANSPAEDLALEEAIHSAVEDGVSPNTWRVWQARTPAVILGTGQEFEKEADMAAAARDGASVLRRHSGGGTVVIGPGVINFSAFYRFADLPGADTIRGAMTAALQPVIAALSGWGLRAQEAGLSDLAVATNGTLRKIAGNAQARKRRSVVVHGTLLADPDWECLARLLKFPSKAPDYRAGREHSAFLTSLKDLGAPVTAEAFADQLRRCLPHECSRESVPSAEETARAARLLAEKYTRTEWNLRR